jgi:hypothetical protein
MWRVHHASVTRVDADVPESRKEEQVAGLHSGASYPPPLVVERVRAVREVDAESPVGPVDKAGAVEPPGGRYASPSIRDPDCLECNRRRSLSDGPLGNRRPRSVASGPGERAGSMIQGAAEDDRDKCERKQRAAEGRRHKEKRTAGGKRGECAALGLY